MKKIFVLMLFVLTARPLILADEAEAFMQGAAAGAVVGPIIGSLIPGTVGEFERHKVRYRHTGNRAPTQAEAYVAGPMEYPFTRDLTIPHAISVSGVNYYITGMDPACFKQSDISGVSIGDLVRTIPNSAFQYCADLKHVDFHGGVKFIENAAFMGCTSLDSIILPELVKYIGDHAFDQCTRLRRVNIPTACSYIGEFAFYDCYALSDVTFGGNGPEYLPPYCFQTCESLREITLPEGVRYLCDGSFNQSGIERITWGKDLKAIGNDVFIQTPLKEIFSHSAVPPIVGSSFTYDMCARIVVHVPKGAAAAYRTDPFWSNFPNIVEDL